MEKPTLRTLHGTFTHPVRLYSELVPKDLAANAARLEQPSGLRRGMRSFALTAISHSQYVRRSQASRPRALPYQEPA